MRLSRSGLAIADAAPPPVRRRILITTGQGTASAELEDDFHRMGITISHANGVVTAIDGISSRHPWQLCAQAVEMLPELIGTKLETDFIAASGTANPRNHCTHLFDLSALAITAAARKTERRIYDTVSSCDDHVVHLQLYRDDEPLLEWQVDGSIVSSDDTINGCDLRNGFADWCAANLEAETAEAALILRRTAMIAQGRGVDLDQFADATPVANMLHGACYALRKERGPLALRLHGSTMQFDSPPPLTPHEEVLKWFSNQKI